MGGVSTLSAYQRNLAQNGKILVPAVYFGCPFTWIVRGEVFQIQQEEENGKECV